MITLDSTFLEYIEGVKAEAQRCLIPSKAEWLIETDRELIHAYNKFGGLSFTQAMPIFMRAPEARMFDLEIAPITVCNYYSKAVIMLCGEQAINLAPLFNIDDVPDFMKYLGGAFGGLLISRIDKDRGMAALFIKEAFPMMQFFSDHQDDLGIEKDIWGDFSQVADEIVDKARLWEILI